MTGGGQGAGWAPAGSVAPQAPYAQINQPYDGCLSASRPGQISYADSGGLPGMSIMRGGGMDPAGNIPPGPAIMNGGGCDSGCSAPLMRGGRYTNNLSTDMAGFAQIDKVPCLPNWQNPLNLRQSGGGSGGLSSASDMGVYTAGTARYTTMPSSFTDSVGAPLLLNQPLNSVAWSKACTQTGGRRRRNRKNRKSRRN